MKSSPDLFLLIKSMSKSEKRFFKLSASLQSGDKVYLKLFDEIAKQKEYNEKEIIKKFRGEAFINEFWVAKNYLYNVLLKSLEAFGSGSATELRSLVNRAELLLNRGLYSQCRKIVDKLKRLAIRYDHKLCLLEALFIETRLMHIQSFINVSQADIENIYENIYQVIGKYERTTTYGHISTNMLYKMRQISSIRTPKELHEYKKIINHPLFIDEDKADSFEARYYLYNSKAAFFLIKQEYQKACVYLEKSLTECEENPRWISDSPSAYIALLFNLIVCLRYLKKYKEMEFYIQKMNAVKAAKNKMYYNPAHRAYNLLLSVYIDTGNFKEGEQLVQKIEKDFLAINSERLDKEILYTTYFRIALICFGLGKYSQANKSLQKILNSTVSIKYKEIYVHTQILSLLIQYELGNYDLLPYKLQSIYRFLYKREKLYKFETILLRFIRKDLIKTMPGKELKNVFRRLKAELERVFLDPFEKNASRSFDIISWLESKIENRPFVEIVKSKNISVIKR